MELLQPAAGKPGRPPLSVRFLFEAGLREKGQRDDPYGHTLVAVCCVVALACVVYCETPDLTIGRFFVGFARRAICVLGSNATLAALPRLRRKETWKLERGMELQLLRELCARGGKRAVASEPSECLMIYERVSVKVRNLAVVWVFWCIVLSLAASLHPLEIGAQSPNQVGLVVGLGDGSVVTRCVEFAEAEISGYDLLMRSGLQVVASQSSGAGVTICEIDGTGCPANNCFCKCSGSTCTYWSYWHLVGGEWSYASVGANGRRLHSGDVDGWMWGQGDPPPVVPLEQICAPPATATPLPTASPTPVPTATPTLPPTAIALLPTHTPQPADAATLLPTATWTPTSIPSPASPTPLPSATSTSTATLQAPAATPSPTPSPQSVAAQRATPSATSAARAARPSPTLRPRQATPTVSPEERETRSNYVLFGVLLAVLGGVMVVIAIQRKR